MSEPTTVVQYWAGCPKSPNSKWQRFLAIVRRCREEGWRSYLVWSSMPEDPALVTPFHDAGCEIVLQPRSRQNFDPVSVWRTYRLLRRLNCDVFHCHNDHTSPLISAVLARVPVRIWSKLAMSSYYEKNVRPRGMHRLMLSTRVSCLCAHRVMAVSDQVRRELVDSVGFGGRTDVVYAPVDYARFANAARGEIRHELGLRPSQLLITSIGHAVPVKGWDIAIEAFARISKFCPDVHMVFVGSTSSSEEMEFFSDLRKQVSECGLSGCVHFLGHRRDVPEILKASDIFVLPSRSDGLGSALIEAMAAGLPCVAANVGGIPDVICSEGDDGLLFERENPAALAGHLVRLMEDRSLRSRIGSRASMRARSFNMQVYVRQVFECYRALVGANSRKTIGRLP